MRRYFGTIAYKGAAYAGFQRQKSLPSVQAELERALSFLLGEDIAIAGAGRTDAKVHATGQTFTFDCSKRLGQNTLPKLNHLLPKDILVESLVEVEPAFHARHSSCGKEYIYRLLPNGRRPFEVDSLAQIERTDFDLPRFKEAIAIFQGIHNFQNFTTKKDDVDGFIRNIEIAEVSLNGEVVETRFKGNGFMTYQIRLMVGSAIKVALGQLEVVDLQNALCATKRKILSFKAPPEGLYLTEVFYESVPTL